jgi:uncharacterized protein with FMN-binding domain
MALKVTKGSRFRAFLFCILPLAVAAGCDPDGTPGTSSTSKYKADVYTVDGSGYRNGLKVSVTFSEDEITLVEVKSHNETISLAGLSETEIADVEKNNTIASVLEALKQIPLRIVEKQQSSVDIVGGASRTSEGIMQAVLGCIRQARNY